MHPNSDKSSYTLGVVQMAMEEKSETNILHALDMCEQAARAGAQVILLPELFASPYFCQKEDVARFQYAEAVNGELKERFSTFAQKHQVSVVVSFFEKRAPGLYHNSVQVLDADGESLGIYRKMHIPDDPAYYEKFYFTPGDLGFKVFHTKFGCISPLICWDQWYPEAARIAALQGATALLYPTAIGWHPFEKEEYGAQQLDAWITVQRGHAIANGVYVAASNRLGHEAEAGQDGILFWGASFICDPQGVILAQGSHDKEEVLLADIDLDHLETIRCNWPFYRDRRIDAFEEIQCRFIDSPNPERRGS